MRPHKLTPGYWVKRAAEISSKATTEYVPERNLYGVWFSALLGGVK